MALSKVQQLMQHFSGSYQLKNEIITGTLMFDDSGELIYQTDTINTAIGDLALQSKLLFQKKIVKSIQFSIKQLMSKGVISGSSVSSVQIPVEVDDKHKLTLQCDISNRLKEKNGNAIVVSYKQLNKIAENKDFQEIPFSWIKVLESVISNVKDGVILLEANAAKPAETKIVFVNSSFVKISGYQDYEIIGRSTRFFKSVFHCPIQLQNIKKAIRKHKAFEITLTIIGKNDLVHDIDCAFKPLTNDDGIHTHWVAIVKDVTENKQIKDVWRKASSLTGMGSWSYDLQKQQIYWSETAKLIYQVEPTFEPTLANTAHFFKVNKTNQQILEQIGNAFTTARPFDIEIEILTAKNNKKWLRIIGEPEFVKGQCKRITGSFLDIDGRKKAEITAQKLTAERNEILESIGDGFFAVNKQWKVIFWNSKAAEELKRSKEELMHQNLWDVFSEAVGSYAYNQYHLAMQSKKPIHFESYSRPNGKWYDISAYPSANGLSVYFKNITHQKLDRQQLIDSEKRYSDLFQLSPLPKWVFDLKSLRFLDVNLAAVKHYGYSHQEFLSMTIFDIRPSSEEERLKKVLHQSKRKKKFIYQGLFTHQKKNKELIRVSIQSALVNFKGHKAKLVIANDITDQEKYLHAIEQQNQKLKEVAWIQSHVFRAPLTKIMGLTDILRSTDEQERTLAIDYIQEAAQELDHAIKEITDRSKTNSLTINH